MFVFYTHIYCNFYFWFKYDGNILFIQYWNIGINSFVQFIKDNNWPKSLYEHIECNQNEYSCYSLFIHYSRHEITIVFDEYTNVLRTSFMGMF